VSVARSRCVVRAFVVLLLGSVAAVSHASPERDPTLRDGVNRLVDAALESDGAWEKLGELCDGIGHRLSGSPGLARAVEWATERMLLDGLENVRRQRVMVPHWVRGEESAFLVSPRRAPLAMLGLGRSIGTPPGGITAPVIVVNDFDEFEALRERDVREKIVLWNAPFTTYSETVKYRWEGAERASRKGAVASLVRTVGRRSLRSPHTGSMKAYENVRPIPAAAISIEDALMIERLAASGKDVRVHLEMSARTLPDAESLNVIGEIVGRELPHEVVGIGGHLDSWDVGQGASDDGGGCVISMEAVRLMHATGLRPRRTVRVVLWTNEENGTRGGEAYRDSLGGDFRSHVAAIESDGGVEAPWGFGISAWKSGTRDADETRQALITQYLIDTKYT
jgi:carboxypeptidase Q